MLAVFRPGVSAPTGRVPGPDARALVLKTRAERGAATLDPFPQSVTFLNEAIRRDPEYEGACEELAIAYAGASESARRRHHRGQHGEVRFPQNAGTRPRVRRSLVAQDFVDAMVFQRKLGEDELRRAPCACPAGRPDPPASKRAVWPRISTRCGRNSGLIVGMLYFMRRRYDLALAQWTRVSAQLESSSDADLFSFSAIYGALGDRDRAFTYLEEAWPHHNCCMLKVYPFLDPLRSDSRYESFLKRAGFNR